MKKVNFTVAGLLFTIAGLLFLCVNLHTMRLDRRFVNEGKITQAVVVKQYTSRPDRRSNPDYFLRASYRADDGTTHELDEQVTEEFWRRHPEAASVQVRYLMSRPDTAEITGGEVIKPNYMFRSAIGATAVVAGILLLFLRRFFPKSK